MNLKDIKQLSIKNEKSLEQIVLKLAEETGEVSQALLSYLKANGSAYKGLTDEDVKEECVDVIIVALSLFYKLNGQDAEFESIFDKKVAKWKEKIGEDPEQVIVPAGTPFVFGKYSAHYDKDLTLEQFATETYIRFPEAKGHYYNKEIGEVLFTRIPFDN